MTFSLFEADYLVMLIPAVVIMIIGMIWYGPLFGKLWANENEPNTTEPVTKDRLSQRKRSIYLRLLISSLVTSFVLTYFFNTWWKSSGLHQISRSVIFAFMAWLGFVVPVIYSGLIGRRHLRNKLVDLGYYFITFLVAAATIAIMMNIQEGILMQESPQISRPDSQQKLPNFKMTLPEGMVAVNQNATPTYTDAIAVHISDFDKMQSSKSFPGNPLLAAIEAKIPYLVISKSSAKVTDIKDYLPTFVENPKGGSFDVETIEFVERYSDLDQNITNYEYVYRIKSNPPVDRHGFIWRGNDGNVYEIQIFDNQPIGTAGVVNSLIEEVAIQLYFTYEE